MGAEPCGRSVTAVAGGCRTPSEAGRGFMSLAPALLAPYCDQSITTITQVKETVYQGRSARLCIRLGRDGVTAFIVIAAIIVFVVFILPYLANDKTKIFRRVWSSERAMGGSAAFSGTHGHLNSAQDVAVKALMERYGISTTASRQELMKPVASLMADAMQFDTRNPRNLGVEVTPVLAREIRNRCPSISGDDHNGDA